MKSQIKFFHCGKQLINTLTNELQEIETIVGDVVWMPEFYYSENGTTFKYQNGYNHNFAAKFKTMGWISQPLLREEPKLIGDFQKGLVFVEIQFGNSSTLYRDYYKFQYGLANGLLSLAVLMVPTNPKQFFPTRPDSIRNMAEFNLAESCLSVLPINVPVLLIGLIPEN